MFLFAKAAIPIVALMRCATVLISVRIKVHSSILSGLVGEQAAIRESRIINVGCPPCFSGINYISCGFTVIYVRDKSITFLWIICVNLLTLVKKHLVPDVT